MRAKTAWLLLAILCLASFAVAQDTAWEKYMKAGMEAYQQGQYAEAEKQFSAALKEAEKFGEQDPRVGSSLNNLAALYQVQGKYGEAEPLYRRSLAIREKALGSEHREVAQSLNNLAGLYHAQGKYAEAEPLFGRALAINEKALGPAHPAVAISLGSLASLYHDQSKSAEAEPLFKRALAILEKALGPEHPNVATGLNNLASLYHAQGKYAEAEQLSRRALAIREKVLAPEHPHLTASLNNLALLYDAQGKSGEAEPLLRRALAIAEKALGPEHPNVATALENYAGLLRKTNREAEAATMEARAKAIRAKHAAPYLAPALTAAQKKINYKEISFELPTGDWKRDAESETQIGFSRTEEKHHGQNVGIWAVEFPASLRALSQKEHASGYFDFERRKGRPQTRRWEAFSEGERQIGKVRYPIMTFRMTATDTTPVALFDGLFLLYFPEDFDSRQRFYCFMWMDGRPATEPGRSDANLAMLDLIISSVRER